MSSYINVCGLGGVKEKVTFMGPYLCLLWRMESAYADWGLLEVIYLICSLYLCSRHQPV
jgi:hypothetical protein